MPTTTESGPVQTRPRSRCKSWTKHKKSQARWTRSRGPDITYPGTRVEDITKGNFAGGRYYVAPDGRGAAFDSSGAFQYFGVFGQ